MSEARLLATALWTRNDVAMMESCRVSETGGLHLLEGTVVTALEGVAADLRYEVIASPGWQSLAARIRVQRANEVRTIEMSRDGMEHWSVNGTVHPEFDGLLDLDLGFSPCTNTLAIRRLNLEIGDSADVTAVWLQFPSLTPKPLMQSYTRIAEWTYRYDTPAGFTGEIEVDRLGMVQRYDRYWTRVAG